MDVRPGALRRVADRLRRARRGTLARRAPRTSTRSPASCDSGTCSFPASATNLTRNAAADNVDPAWTSASAPLVALGTPANAPLALDAAAIVSRTVTSKAGVAFTVTLSAAGADHRLDLALRAHDRREHRAPAGGREHVHDQALGRPRADARPRLGEAAARGIDGRSLQRVVHRHPLNGPPGACTRRGIGACTDSGCGACAAPHCASC